MLKCQFKSLTDIDCPGCGIQRAALALLDGDLAASFMYYPGLIPLLIGLIFTFTFMATKKDALIVIAKGLYITAGILIAGNWLLKLFGLLPCPV